MQFQAPTKEQQVSASKKYVDTRSTFKLVWESFTKFETALMINICCCVIAIVKPWTFLFAMLMVCIVTLRASLSKSNKTLPIKLPIELKDKFTDYNAPLPGRRKFKKASGTVMLGNTRDTGELEVWQEGSDLVLHGLVIGTTGSGKTETLISLIGATAFCQGGGTSYTDPKAGNLLLVQMVTLCKIFGRIDDLRVLNYKTGGITIQEKHYEKKTNTFNPFALGTDKNIFQVLGALLPADAGQNQSFLNSAIELMKAVLPSLCELRDRGYLQLTPGLLADYLSIKHLANLVRLEVEDRSDFKSIVFDPTQDERGADIEVKISRKSLRPLEMYFSTLGYDASKGIAGQPENVTRSFGYAKSYYGEPLSNLAANFGHMYDHVVPETSLEDIIFNNRLFLTLIPALEFPPAEQQNLGKITLSSLKQAMSLGLGPQTEGTYTEIEKNLPVDKKVPFVMVVDEYPEVAVERFAVVATQSRSLGISSWFGAQDLAGLARESEDDAEMIFANTLTKYLMRCQDPEKTKSKFTELAGKVLATESDSYGQGGTLNVYKRDIAATIREVDRISWEDVVTQMEGEAHLFERGKVHKINTFYHGMDESLYKTIEFRYNRLLPVLAPSDKDIQTIDEHLKSIDRLAKAHAAGTIYPDIEPVNFKTILEKESPTGGIFIDGIKIFKNTQPVSQKSSTEHAPAQEVAENTTTAAGQPQEEQTQPPVQQQHGGSEDIIEQVNINIEELKKQASETDVTEEKPANIHDVISMAENHWIFDTHDPESDDSVADILTKQISALNAAIIGENSAEEEVVKNMVDQIAEELPYTSKPPVEAKDDDMDKCWEVMNSLMD